MKLSPTDKMILDCYVIGACGARALAAELRKPMQYIYFRGPMLAKRLGIERDAIKTPGPVRRRSDPTASASEIARAGRRYANAGVKRIDWDLVRELKDDGASAGEIAEFLNAELATILRGQARVSQPCPERD